MVILVGGDFFLHDSEFGQLFSRSPAADDGHLVINICETRHHGWTEHERDVGAIYNSDTQIDMRNELWICYVSCNTYVRKLISACMFSTVLYCVWNLGGWTLSTCANYRLVTALVVVVIIVNDIEECDIPLVENITILWQKYARISSSACSMHAFHSVLLLAVPHPSKVALLVYVEDWDDAIV